MLDTRRTLGLIGLILAVLSVVITGYPLLVLAVIFTALAVLV